jgi:drug/metabolite transporter (DMT)-like permease
MTGATTIEAGATTLRRGVLWATISAAAYSVSAVIGKDLLATLRPSDMLFWRFTVAAPVVWTVLAVRARRGGPRPRTAVFPPMIGLGMLFGYMSLTGFIALDHLDASLYIVLVYVYPGIVAAASPLFGHRVRATMWPAVGLTLVGVVLTVPELFGGGGTHADGFGVTMTFVQAVVLALYTLLAGRVITGTADGLVTIGWSVCGSWLGMAALATLVGLRTPGRAVEWVELAAFAILPTIVAGGTFYHALRTVPPALVAMIATLEPVLTVLWAVLLLGERLRAVQIAGGILVVAGVVWAQRSSAGTAPIGTRGGIAYRRPRRRR